MTKDILLFDEVGANSVFSNVFRREFSFTFPYEFIDKDEIKVRFASQALYACKAAFFDDNLRYNAIVSSSTPYEVLLHAKKIRNVDEDTWSEFREYFMFLILKAKFSESTMKKHLLETGDSFLAYASKDCIWGIGVLSVDNYSTNPRHWKGENALGSALMRTRDHFRDTL